MLRNVPIAQRYLWKLVCVIICATICVGCPPRPTDEVFQLSIERDFDSPEEQELIQIAESVYPAREDVLAVYEVDRLGEPPDGDLWWYTDYGELVPYAITTEAIDYYADLILQWREGYPTLFIGPFFPTYWLTYTANIDYQEMYENEGQTFTDVYVVTMELDWGGVWGPLAGGGFTKERVVVLSPDGESLGIFGDGPVSFWVS
jgi:hypothetical protein